MMAEKIPGFIHPQTSFSSSMAIILLRKCQTWSDLALASFTAVFLK